MWTVIGTNYPKEIVEAVSILGFYQTIWHNDEVTETDDKLLG